ncbi:acyltransferase family protein [Pseudomonas mosselii]|uniref:acyltransferase family protein n=1 Tax=Pseudomonas mosselii TaxID=78327 RepID=UPI000BB4DC85|nr:acyltransferase family protein [Pseudomonas mosselii]ATB67131.1 acyltransferase [Pseudomonas mosselii]
MSNPNIKYRPDIDGLRAIAVLSVVLFHAFPSLLRGGFIGVDIFFVISGFLITSIIFKSLDNKTFRFADFYGRRIKRIFPALILVLAATYIMGWLSLTAEEFSQLGKHITSGAAFISNFALWSESGYFDTSAQLKPLLHLWSLGIEEQFYIFTPLAMYIFYRFGVSPAALLVCAAIASFALNVKLIGYDPTATFYSPLTRFWELLAGSLLAWFTTYKDTSISTTTWATLSSKQKRLRSLFSFLGLALLIFGLLHIKKGANFPGTKALIPVIGAVFLILAGPMAWVNKNLLSAKPMVWFGLISFPLYLWHWPLFSLLRITEGEPTALVMAAAMLLSVALAWVTYRYLELPIRSFSSERLKVIMPSAAMVVIAAVGGATYMAGGLPERQANKALESYANSIVRSDAKSQAECIDVLHAYKKEGNWHCQVGAAKPTQDIFAFGDSHAYSLLPAFEKLAAEHSLSIAFSSASGCPPLLGVQSMRGELEIEKRNCQALNERIFSYIKSKQISTVVLMGRWSYYSGGTTKPADYNLIAKDPTIEPTLSQSAQDLQWAIGNTVKRFRDIGVNVYFVEDNPQQLSNAKEILRTGKGSEAVYNSLSVSRAEHESNSAFSVNALRESQATVISLDPILCQGSICPLTRDGKFWYFDDNHLSASGALAVYPAIESALMNAAQPPMTAR